MTTSSTAAEEIPRFRLLLHGRDGSVPYLTPVLMRMVFCPDAEYDPADEGWRWRRRHFLLGVAVRDTCVVPVYREAKAKRKREVGGRVGEGSDRPEKRATGPRRSSSYSPRDDDRSGAERRPSTAESETGGNGDAKKPAGYTFLETSRASRICAETISRIDDREEGGECNGEKNATTYMHAHLRIPRYMSTVVVPTFSLECDGNAAGARERIGGSAGLDASEDRGHVPKRQPKNQNPNEQKQQKQQIQRQKQRKGSVVPGSTKNSMPVDTPHGWQRLGPEQYWDAVLSLTRPYPVSAPTRKSLCMGAVGLFDHIAVGRDRPSNLLEESRNDYAAPMLQAPQEAKYLPSLQRLVRRTDEWSRRTLRYSEQLQGTQRSSSVSFWKPVHIAALQMPSAPSPRGDESRRQMSPDGPKNCTNNVAVVGWDAVSCSRECRRRALRRLMTPARSPLTRGQFLLLSVDDVHSMLDAAREGVSIIGTDAVRRWSCSGKALCLDFCHGKEEKEDGGIIGGMMNLGDSCHARDSLPILPGCGCIACRPRRKAAVRRDGDGKPAVVPSFTRAYVHHLIKAREMLAETLLFVHNLHRTLLLFRDLGAAAEKGDLETFCERIEQRLQR